MKGIDEQGKPHGVLVEPIGGDGGAGTADGAPLVVVGLPENPLPIATPTDRPLLVEGEASSPGYTRIQDSDSEDLVEVSAAGASFAATILGLVTRSAGYLWDSTTSTWVRAVCNAAGEVIVAGYTAATQSLRMEEIDPLDQRYESGRVSVTNGADATHDYFYDMAGFKRLDTTIILSCTAGTVTVKVWGSNQDDGTAPGSITDWADLTLDAFRVASLIATAGSATDEWIDDGNVLGGFKWIKYEVVANTGGTTGDWVLNTKKIW